MRLTFGGQLSRIARRAAEARDNRCAPILVDD
jgi:hypothetical protein